MSYSAWGTVLYSFLMEKNWTKDMCNLSVLFLSTASEPQLPQSNFQLTKKSNCNMLEHLSIRVNSCLDPYCFWRMRHPFHFPSYLPKHFYFVVFPKHKWENRDWYEFNEFVSITIQSASDPRSKSEAVRPGCRLDSLPHPRMMKSESWD